MAPGHEPNKAERIVRLKRIEGQIRGLQRMIESDAHCIDVLTQLSAANRALHSVAVGLLDEHVRLCVRGAALGDDPARVDELISEATRAIERLIRS